MSRIGKKPIELTAGVSASLKGRQLEVSGPKGKLSLQLRPEVDAAIGKDAILIKPARDSRKTYAYWGLTRALVSAMVEGASRGFQKKLEIEGIGYRASVDGNILQLALGFSHPVKVKAPEGVTFKVEKNTIIIEGANKELVGNVAAGIRKLRPPEPYKGKGIRYVGERIRRKAGKKAVSSGG